MRCEECGKWVSNHLDSDQIHTFSGYGFYVGYCPEHCPRSVDGSDCDYDHPESEEIKSDTTTTDIT